jgi:hypothetical protein
MPKYTKINIYEYHDNSIYDDSYAISLYREKLKEREKKAQLDNCIILFSILQFIILYLVSIYSDYIKNYFL